MEMNNRWFHFEIISKLEKIKVPSDRIQFLFDKKSKFLTDHKEEDAYRVVLMFDNLIYKEKLLNEFSKNTNQESGFIIDYANTSNIKKNTAESKRLHNLQPNL